MFKHLRTYLRHDWPLHFILLLTNWLPDNVIFLRFRGWLCRPFLASCGHDVNIGRNVAFFNPSYVHFGNFVHISYGCVFIASDHIDIQDEVMLGPYCVLASGNHGRLNNSYRFGVDKTSPITIGKGSWLGAHVVITAGSNVGDGTIVAAGSVVTNNSPSNVIIGGVPARIIKEISE